MIGSKDTKSYFTFKLYSDGKDVTLNFNSEVATVPEVLEEFMNFMRACGYCFNIDDYFDVVNDGVPEVNLDVKSQIHGTANAASWSNMQSWTEDEFDFKTDGYKPKDY